MFFILYYIENIIELSYKIFLGYKKQNNKLALSFERSINLKIEKNIYK